MKRTSLPLLVALSLVPLTIFVACFGSDTPSGDAPPDVYSTRGIVRALPSADQPGSELQIRHEELPDFKSADGEVVGMKSMTMPFPAGAELLDGVSVGDKVSFDFEVRWTGSPPMRVTRLEVLPPDTTLAFESPAEDPSLEEPVLEAQPD